VKSSVDGNRCERSVDNKYGRLRKLTHGIHIKSQGVSNHLVNCSQRSNRRYLGVLLSVLSESTGARHPCSDGLVTLKHGYWNGRAIGSSIRFFIERWERERDKPQLLVERINLPEQEEPRGIRVVLDAQTFKDTDARFFFVSVRNTGSKTAYDVDLRLHLPVVRTGLLGPLVRIGPSGLQFLAVKWSDPLQEFDTNPHRFARALLKGQEEKPIRLDPLGFGVPFMVFFTVKETKSVYFPVLSLANLLPIPCKFIVQLLFGVKDMKIQYTKSFEVDVQTWDLPKITELTLPEGVDPLASLSPKAS